MADIFDEVSEDLRKDQYKQIWLKYKKFIISLISIFVLSIITFKYLEYYQEKNKTVLSKYSKRALNRVWKAIRFSWWMTVTFHKFPNQSDFDQKMQETEIEYLENSEVAQKSFAENYVGLPF